MKHLSYVPERTLVLSMGNYSANSDTDGLPAAASWGHREIAATNLITAPYSSSPIVCARKDWYEM
jgi:hypothetical protein